LVVVEAISSTTGKWLVSGVPRAGITESLGARSAIIWGFFKDKLIVSVWSAPPSLTPTDVPNCRP
jgi:hypothetical protein